MLIPSASRTISGKYSPPTRQKALSNIAMIFGNQINFQIRFVIQNIGEYCSDDIAESVASITESERK